MDEKEVPRKRTWTGALGLLTLVAAAVFLVVFVRNGDRGLRTDLVELAKAGAWPLLTVVALLALRDPLVEFLHGIAPRINKFSVFKIDVELREAAGSKASPLSVAEVRAPLTAAPGSDESSALLNTFADEKPCDYVLVDLGTGEEWLTSRVFILAVMLARLRSLRCVVFVETVNGERNRLVGMASPERVRWCFAMRWPWLDEAFVRAEESVLYLRPVASTGITTAHGGMIASVAQELFKRYLDQPGDAAHPALRVTGGLAPWMRAEEWVQLSAAEPADPMVLRERAEWLTGEKIEKAMQEHLMTGKLPHAPGAPTEKFVRDVLLQSGTFVALVEGERQFKGLVDRSAVAEAVATAHARAAAA